MSMFDDFDDDLIDELEGEPAATANHLVPPRQMTDCIGHSAVEEKLLGLIDSGKMPHALIFSGQNGIGKATLAFRLARYLFKHGVESGQSGDGGLFGDDLPKETHDNLSIDPADPVFSQVASGGHADLLVIERLFDEKKNRYKGSVEVDEVRKITPFMRKTASQGGWRIVIVDDADTMNRNAQNAILKILEEPPANALLVLVCHRLGTMIPTIRSRCRVIDFQPLSADDFGTLIKRDHGNLPQSDIDAVYAIAGGSVGRALQIIEEGGLEAVSKVMGLLHSWPEWQWSQIHVLADGMSRPGQENSLQAFQDVMLWVVESLLRAQARGIAPPRALDNEVTQKLLAHFSLHDWIEIASQLKEHFDTVQHANLDKRHAVLGAFSLFKEAA